MVCAIRCWLASIWQSFNRETVVYLIRPSNVEPSSGSTSNWPQRSVSASDQRWICFFGANPEVLSERIVSDISPTDSRSKRYGSPRKRQLVRCNDVGLIRVHNLRQVVGAGVARSCRHPVDNPLT